MTRLQSQDSRDSGSAHPGDGPLKPIFERGLVPPTAAAELTRVAERYSVAITPAMLDLVNPGVPDDPIARQFLPDPAELRADPHELTDPVGDQPHSPVPGIVHRYPDRVLLMPLTVCPVYCRFCFRRETVGPKSEALLGERELDAALDYIRAHNGIWEVILSGGDPLLLSARRLRRIFTALNAIDHVRVVRIHSRIPVVDPDRIDPGLLAAIDTEKALYVVLHCNHARELFPAARSACARIVDAGIPMLSQSVLLGGVNDDPEALEGLFRALVETRVKPYYLHHLDPAPGTARFRTGLAAGQALLRDLRGRVSGLCQPAYVLDIPGGHGKVPVGPQWLEPGPGDGVWTVRDPWGGSHRYADSMSD